MYIHICPPSFVSLRFDAAFGVKPCMWEKIAFIPFAVQNLFCPNRTSDTLLLALLAWICGVAFGAAVTGLVLSPWLRKCLVRAAAFALQEAVPVPEPGGRSRTDRLERYRH